MNVSQVLASEASRKSKLVAGWFPRPGIRKTGMISVNHAVEIHTSGGSTRFSCRGPSTRVPSSGSFHL